MFVGFSGVFFTMPKIEWKYFSFGKIQIIRWDRDEERSRGAERAEQNNAQSVVALRTAPPYGKRKGWIPRTTEDFGDGGAFPEIHVAQVP